MPEATADHPTPPRTSWCGPLSLICGLAYVGFALTMKETFLHQTESLDLSGVVLLQETLFGAILIVGLVAGWRGLRRPGRVGKVLSILALSLLSPCVADLLCLLPARLVQSVSVNRTIFIVVTEALIVLTLVVGIRALRGEPTRQRSPSARSDRPRSATWVGRLLLLLSTIVVSLLVAETLFRWFGPRDYASPMLVIPGAEKPVPLSQIYLFMRNSQVDQKVGPSAAFRPYLFIRGWYDRPIWGYFDEDGCVDYVFNGLGFRDNEFAVEKKPDEYRVLAIGDSFTFGIGVQLDDCWTEWLERRLEESRDGPVEVINAGFVAGYTPATYAAWILDDGVALKPDVVIVGLCLNDMHLGVDMLADLPVRPAPLLGGHSKLLIHIQRIVAEQARPANRVRNYAALIRSEPECWQKTRAGLKEMHAGLSEKGIRLVVAIFPMLSRLQNDYPYAKIMEMAHDFCDAEGIEHVDLREQFLGKVDTDLWVHPTDQHPNHLGQDLIAEGILDYLSR